MKRLIIIIIFTFGFQSLIKADDVRDITIEGISIEDSLLNYMSKKEINNSINNSASYYKDNKFVAIVTNIKAKDFDGNVEITFKPKDKNYTIHSIAVLKNFQNNFDDCKKEKSKKLKDIAELVGSAERLDVNEKHAVDPSGNSFSFATEFYFKSGGYLDLKCNDWSEELTQKEGWFDSLYISIGSDEFTNFLLNEAW